MRMRSLRVIALAAIAAVGLLSQRAEAVPVVFSGFDSGVNLGGATPNSDAAAASFQAASAALLGTSTYVNFESAPLGSFTSLSIAPGVSISGTDYLGASQTIRNTPISGPSSVFGFNTTPGGANFVYVNAGTLTFTFAAPVQAFGAYFTGVQLAGQTITFSDGSSQTIAIPFPGGSGGVSFAGFTDAGQSIASITIVTPNPSNSLGDFIGVDDVRFTNNVATVSGPAVPLPSSAWGGLALVGGLGLVQLRRKNAAL